MDDFDWLDTITDQTLRRIAVLERECRRLNQRCDTLMAIARILACALLGTTISIWVLAWAMR